VHGADEFFDEHGNFVETLDMWWLTIVKAVAPSAA
jgi:hypothetical protein